MYQKNVEVEDYKKLKQLDRIEYLLRAKHLDEQKPKFTFFEWLWAFVNLLWMILVLFMLIAIYAYHSPSAQLIGLEMVLAKFLVLIKMMIPGVLSISLITWYVLYLKWTKHRRQLVQEFFEVKAK